MNLIEYLTEFLDMEFYDSCGLEKMARSQDSDESRFLSFREDNLPYRFADVEGDFERGVLYGMAYAHQDVMFRLLSLCGLDEDMREHVEGLDDVKGMKKYREAFEYVEGKLYCEIVRMLCHFLEVQREERCQ